MKILLLVSLMAVSADARGRKSPTCPEGFYTYVETRVSGAANPSLQRHRIKARKKFSKYDCRRCKKNTITVVDGLGWNICLGGRSKSQCGPHAAPVPTGDPQRPTRCIPCGPGERQVVVNEELRCLPHNCEKGTAPARYRGVTETYRCAEPYEDPDTIVWDKVTPPAPKVQPITPECGKGEGLSWDSREKAYSCRTCGEDLEVLQRNGYPVCGRKTKGFCGKREVYVATADLSGRPSCQKCPKRYRFDVENGIPRCLKPLAKPKKKNKKKKIRIRKKRRGAAVSPRRF